MKLFPSRWYLRSLRFAAVLLLGVTPAGSQVAPTHDGIAISRPPVPAPECKAPVGYDRDAVLPGYLLPTSAGPATCIPFTSARFKPPAGYTGDFYVDEFTDAKLRAQWEECKRDKSCYDRVYAQVISRHPPNREQSIKDPHKRFLLGKIEEKGDATDLRSIRRPSYFARAPYHEPIADDDAQTYIVEFTAPAEAYERLHLHVDTEVKLRGWYIQGTGVDDGKGHKVRTLVTISGGGGDRVTAIDDPSDADYQLEPGTGATVPNDDYPNATTGVKGMAAWRGVVHQLHQAGFDVLEFDRRGVGISSGTGETNTLQQGH